MNMSQVLGSQTGIPLSNTTTKSQKQAAEFLGNLAKYPFLIAQIAAREKRRPFEGSRQSENYDNQEDHPRPPLSEYPHPELYGHAGSASITRRLG
jgi:hypothetical protein